jgi:hypothetical protein
MNLERGDQDLQLEWVRLLAGATKTDMDAPAFLGAMRRWIARVDKVSGGFEQCKGSLATLLLDLDSGQHLLKEQCPRLRRLLEREHRGGDALERSRRRRLQRLGGRVLLPEVMVLLKKHAATLVPDPAGDYGSNYDSCSEWMAAVHELSPEGAGKLLRRWQEVHHRRRNLWKALSSRGLSGPAVTERASGAGVSSRLRTTRPEPLHSKRSTGRLSGRAGFHEKAAMTGKTAREPRVGRLTPQQGTRRR